MSAIIIASSVAASSAAMSASNSAKIEQDRTGHCILFVEGFDSKKSSVVEQKYYASCVQRLNPDPKTESDMFVGKVCVIMLLLALVAGIIKGWSDDGAEGAFWYGICFPLFLALGLCILAMVAGGIIFVFS